uniref:Uncharacterized protein n=1 Tax=Micrurus paraensis TaxID=1970185 RepID=A0A2D4L5L3_9SAUR
MKTESTLEQWQYLLIYHDINASLKKQRNGFFLSLYNILNDRENMLKITWKASPTCLPRIEIRSLRIIIIIWAVSLFLVPFYFFPALRVFTLWREINYHALLLPGE